MQHIHQFALFVNDMYDEYKHWIKKIESLEEFHIFCQTWTENYAEFFRAKHNHLQIAAEFEWDAIDLPANTNTLGDAAYCIVVIEIFVSLFEITNCPYSYDEFELWWRDNWQ